MDKIVRFPATRKSYEEAARWLARLDKARSEDVIGQFTDWLRADPVNRVALLELAELWDAMDVLSELSAIFPLEPANPRRSARPIARAAVASLVVCLIAVSGWALYTLYAGFGHGSALRFEKHLSTAIGGHSTDLLPDGSILTLNTNTQIDVRYSEKTRDVFLLSGEANFRVAHDTVHPFDVHVGDRVVQAVGTAFNIRIDPGKTIELTVTEGKVRVSGPGGLRGRAERSGRKRPGTEKHASGEDHATVKSGELAILDENVSGGECIPEDRRARAGRH